MPLQNIHCNSCLTEKPISEFYPYCLNNDGTTGQCKACRIHKKKIWDQANPKLALLYVQRSRARDPEKHKLLHQKVYQRMVARGTKGESRQLNQRKINMGVQFHHKPKNVKTRVETGPVQFGKRDWPGVFIRGKIAQEYSESLDAFLDTLPIPADEKSQMHYTNLLLLTKLLRSCKIKD